MRVVITDNAYNDIKEYINFSKSSDKNIFHYVSSLLSYANDLGNFPEMGKFDFTLKINSKTYDIRKLVYKKHKILYYIDNRVHILGIIHTKMNQADYIRKLKIRNWFCIYTRINNTYPR